MTAPRNVIQQLENFNEIITAVVNDQSSEENGTIPTTGQDGHNMISDVTTCSLGNQPRMQGIFSLISSLDRKMQSGPPDIDMEEFHDRADEGENRNEEDQDHMEDLEASSDRVKVSEGVKDQDDSVHNSTVTFEAVNPHVHNNLRVLQLDCSSRIKEFYKLPLPGANSKLPVGDQVEDDQTREIGVTTIAKGANISDAEQVTMTPVVKTTEEMLMEATTNADTDGLDIFSPNLSTPRQPEDDVLAPKTERRAQPDKKSFFSEFCFFAAGTFFGVGLSFGNY